VETDPDSHHPSNDRTSGDREIPPEQLSFAYQYTLSPIPEL
jgi:hypothetical protein